MVLVVLVCRVLNSGPGNGCVAILNIVKNHSQIWLMQPQLQLHLGFGNI